MMSSGSKWTDSACKVLSSTADETICECSHLSSFTVLVDLHDYVPDPVLEDFSIAASALSIAGIFLTLIFSIKGRHIKLDSDRSLTETNCCLCLLIAHIMIITVLDKRFFNIPDEICNVIAGILQYILTAAFLWMSVEAYHLYHLIVVVFVSARSYRSHYFIVGYIFPFIPIILTELASQVLEMPAYGRDELCWLQTNFIWSFDGPIFFLTAVNLLIIIIAMRTAICKTDHHSFQTWWLWCKGLASLCFLMGVTWLVALVFIDANVSVFFQYLFVVLNGMQGFHIFVFQCIFNNQNRMSIYQLCCPHSKPNDSLSISGKATIDTRENEFSNKTGNSSLTSSSGVKVVNISSGQPGKLVFRTNTPKKN